MNRRFILLIIFLFNLFSCTRNESASIKSQQELRLAIWGNYLSPDTQQKWEQTTGIKLKISYYSSNEDLLAKIQASGNQFDVAVPSDYMVEILSKGQLLQKLDKSKLPIIENLDTQFLEQSFDPLNEYSLPYAWSTTGIARQTDLFPERVDSWKELFENTKLKGKISVLDDVREVAGAVLKLHGFSLNTQKKEELEVAKKYLKAHKNQIKIFRSEAVDALLQKEVPVAMAYSTDALQAQKKSGGKIEFIIPKEGSSRAIDNLVILKNAKNLEQAYKFINFVLNAENNKNFVESILAGPVVKATFNLLSKDLQNNPALFPPTQVFTRLEKLQDLGEYNKNYEDLWIEVKNE